MKSRKAKIQRIPFRRKRQGKTNYKRRRSLLLSGKPRLVIRPSNKGILCQIVEYGETGDKVLFGAEARELEKMGWKFGRGNMPGAYLTGLLLGIKAKKNNVKEAVLDSGLMTLTHGSRIYACLKGVIDAGVEIPHSEEILPPEERVSGKHIADYAAKVKENKEVYEKRFSGYLKNNLNPEDIAKVFEEVKKKILAGEK